MNKVVLDQHITSPIFQIDHDSPTVFNHFESDFLLLYVMKGYMKVSVENENSIFNEGDFIFVNRNHLARLVMIPKYGDRFKAIYIMLSSSFLQYSAWHDFKELNLRKHETIDFYHQILPRHILLKSLFQYLDILLKENYRLNEKMENLKLVEVIQILLLIDPMFANCLFLPTNYKKISLNEFMNKNFRYNVPLIRFAQLTGRSLSAFKRDFSVEFGTTPSHWILNRRLSEAYQQLQTGKKPGEIFINLGFESFSHFSKTFKKRFHISPSSVKKQISDIDQVKT